MLSFVTSQYKISSGNVTRQQAEDFVSQINAKLEKKASLFYC